ncbi:alpha/beta hydrolase [Mesonia sp.]|uniref:alpha/beta hydrolase n=1 Tax=Mesonia sp. TaxID=1960830 RepID=UPI0025B7B806|nr:alpha/beta hydrolase [Mesonia sp.]
MEGTEPITHVYFMPGMAANPSIFEHINLPDNYKIHWLKWKIPYHNECMHSYITRMLEDVVHTNPVLIGVSFGGVIVQEMAKLISVKRLILVSTVKSKHELPARMKLARKTGLYKILPTSLAGRIGDLEKLPVGEFTRKRAHLYKQYLSVSDKQYLDWAIQKMVCWDQEAPLENTIHIHGDSDLVFPIKNIENCIIVEGGTHIMIINRFRWFNQHLVSLIEDGALVEN